MIVQSVFAVVISFGLAMYYEWRLGLVVSCFVPVMLIGIYFQMRIVLSQDSTEASTLADSSKV